MQYTSSPAIAELLVFLYLSVLHNYLSHYCFFHTSFNKKGRMKILMAEINKAHPFLKWVGGKRQLIPEIEKLMPEKINKYAEPFVGGGAVLFHVLNKYNPASVYISDANAELINTYINIRDNPQNLIHLLKEIENEYIPADKEKRKEYYYEKRNRFNILKTENKKEEMTEKAALMIFLNKTCFNGEYRVNSSGGFNVPHGKYENPLICDEDNINIVSDKLKKVKIVHGDFHLSGDFIDKDTFVYFDPPYRPISKGSNFTAYTKNGFNDKSQEELADFIDYINSKGAGFILSNSDPHNADINDDFFDNLYKNYKINRVDAKRIINCMGNKRGKIKELLITNLQYI